MGRGGRIIAAETYLSKKEIDKKFNKDEPPRLEQASVWQFLKGLNRREECIKYKRLERTENQ